MRSHFFHRFFNIFISLVWVINGLYAKVLDLVPRHRLIVGRILEEEYSLLLTRVIGFSEILMAVWVLSKIKARWCAVIQIGVVATMNIIEFFAAPDLLLFGRWNAVFAFLFIVAIFANEFLVTKENLK